MPSAYRLAQDKVEQSRAMLAGEVWHDAELDHIFALLIERLKFLDDRTMEGSPPSPSSEERDNIVKLFRALPGETSDAFTGR